MAHGNVLKMQAQSLQSRQCKELYSQSGTVQGAWHVGCLQQMLWHTVPRGELAVVTVGGCQWQHLEPEQIKVAPAGEAGSRVI